MASGLSDYLEATLLNHVFRATYYTPPDTIYLALLTAVASDSTTGTEVTGGSYARQPITFNAATSGIGKMTSAASFRATAGTISGYSKPLTSLMIDAPASSTASTTVGL